MQHQGRRVQADDSPARYALRWGLQLCATYNVRLGHALSWTFAMASAATLQDSHKQHVHSFSLLKRSLIYIVNNTLPCTDIHPSPVSLTRVAMNCVMLVYNSVMVMPGTTALPQEVGVRAGRWGCGRGARVGVAGAPLMGI